MAAGALTDYWSQGQTISYVLVDIADCHLEPSIFSTFMLLCREAQGAISADLLTEDDRLHLLDEKTRKWWVQMMTD
ncbi:hypothetical protein EDC04DRAFT_2665951, partial [Pisolithus marmoratus]